MLLGYWPRWQSHVYWYLLMAGVLAVPLLTGRNPYCTSICPFGATQQCLAVVGGARRRVPTRCRAYLPWVPRILAWAVILLALTHRNPALVSYEVYGALFHVVGDLWQFVLLAAVLVASLAITRPWCKYLCPTRVVIEYVVFGRNWARKSWGRKVRAAR